jgi:hypothetical protein
MGSRSARMARERSPDERVVTSLDRPDDGSPLAAWVAVVRSVKPWEFKMTFGYVLVRAAYDKARTSVLDWGGSLGHYALMARALLPELPIDVTVKDLPELAGEAPAGCYLRD